MHVDMESLLRDLRVADHEALTGIDRSKAYAPIAPTIFAFAVEYLEERGAPDPSWPVWGPLLTVTLAIAALHNRAEHSGLLRDLATIIGLKEGPTDAAQILLDYIDTSDVWLVDVLGRSLAGRKGKGAFVPLEPTRAIEMLGIIGHPSILETLMPLAERSGHQLAPYAALALARAGMLEARETVVSQLRTKARPESIEAAGLLRCEEALPQLLELAEPGGVWRGRTGPHWLPALSTALARIAGEDAIPPLRRLMDALSPDEDNRLCVATDLARLGDEGATDCLKGQVLKWAGARVFWGKEPLQAKWEAANLLALRGDARAQMLVERWYGYNDKSIAFGPDSRAIIDRETSLRTMGRTGNRTHLPFLEWVMATDRQQGEKGWPLSVEAKWATDRIRAREGRRAQ